jgi:hypothetical protein
MIRIILALLAFVTLAIPAYAADPIGTIIELEGTASRDGAPLAADAEVFTNDTITTGPASRALILFVDDTEITLGEDASLTLDEYVYEPGIKNPSAEFSVVKGSFLMVSGLVSKVVKPEVKVNTAYGSIGLRGTTVWGGELDGEYGVLVQDGAVDVTNDGGTTRVTKGFGTFMKNRMERPRLPKAWAAAKTDRAVAAIALKRAGFVKQKLETEKVKNTARREKLKLKVEDRFENKRGDLQDGVSPEQREDVIERMTGKKVIGGKTSPRKRYNR